MQYTVVCLHTLLHQRFAIWFHTVVFGFGLWVIRKADINIINIVNKKVQVHIEDSSETYGVQSSEA